MPIKVRPKVIELEDGGKYWEHEYSNFYLKAYIPSSTIDGHLYNYSFKAPLLLVFEEERREVEEAIKFAKESGLAEIAAGADASVLFVYPTNDGGWEEATVTLYQELIAEIKIDPIYDDGICAVTDFFKQEFVGYYIRGTKFRTDIYSYGASADYVGRYLLDTVEGEYLWGPGDITPAMCYMQNLSSTPRIKRKDIAIISVGNSDDINLSMAECENLLVKDAPDYVNDYLSFVCKFKMWNGVMELEPDLNRINMIEERDCVTVKTSSENNFLAGKTEEHKVGYFAYYNEGLFDEGKVPLLVGFHGGGDSAFYFTYVTRWWEIAHKYGFLFVSIENHQYVPACEAIEVIKTIMNRYNIDEHRIYATGFSMGSSKTWDMYQEYPQFFAGLAPCSALFPIKDNPFGKSIYDDINKDTPVPLFYSGGEASPLPELPSQAETALDRIQYLAGTNDLSANFDYKYSDKEDWEDKIWSAKPDRIEVLNDESRGSKLTINYYNSNDGICRTALASVSDQQHECRHHSCEAAWKFISNFSRE